MQPYRSPWMTEELEIFRQSVRRFFENEVVPNRRKWQQQHHIDREIWVKAAELGIIGVSIPEEFGGLGGSFAHEAVVIEEQARIADADFPFVPGAMNIPHFLLGAASREQTESWMPAIIAGEKMISVAISEPDAGTDVKMLRTSARRDGDHYVINGSKIFITLGKQADYCIVAARTGEAGARGISLIMVEPAKTPGFKVGKVLEKIGQHGIDTCELFFEDMRVPVENLLGGEEGRGFGQLMNSFLRERMAIATVGVATAERAVEMTVDYAKQRKMFEMTLWDFQNTRFKLAECRTEAHIGRVFLDSLIMKFVNGEEISSAEASMAKYWCTDKQCRIIDECLQIYGGYGYMAEYPIAQLYVDARVQRIYGGSNEIMKELIARSM